MSMRIGLWEHPVRLSFSWFRCDGLVRRAALPISTFEAFQEINACIWVVGGVQIPKCRLFELLCVDFVRQPYMINCENRFLLFFERKPLGWSVVKKLHWLRNVARFLKVILLCLDYRGLLKFVLRLVLIKAFQHCKLAIGPRWSTKLMKAWFSTQTKNNDTSDQEKQFFFSDGDWKLVSSRC